MRSASAEAQGISLPALLLVGFSGVVRCHWTLGAARKTKELVETGA